MKCGKVKLKAVTVYYKKRKVFLKEHNDLPGAMQNQSPGRS